MDRLMDGILLGLALGAFIRQVLIPWWVRAHHRGQ